VLPVVKKCIDPEIPVYIGYTEVKYLKVPLAGAVSVVLIWIQIKFIWVELIVLEVMMEESIGQK
jgi:hypothetical protein